MWTPEEIEQAKKYKNQALKCWEQVLSISDDTDFCEQIKTVKYSIDAGEWGLALEFMCEHIYEFEVHITSVLYQELLKACTDLGIDKKYVDNIQYLVIE